MVERAPNRRRPFPSTYAIGPVSSSSQPNDAVPIRSRVVLKRFPIKTDGSLGPQTHGDFNQYCFWREDFLRSEHRGGKPLFGEAVFARDNDRLKDSCAHDIPAAQQSRAVAVPTCPIRSLAPRMTECYFACAQSHCVLAMSNAALCRTGRSIRPFLSESRFVFEYAALDVLHPCGVSVCHSLAAAVQRKPSFDSELPAAAFF